MLTPISQIIDRISQDTQVIFEDFDLDTAVYDWGTFLATGHLPLCTLTLTTISPEASTLEGPVNYGAIYELAVNIETSVFPSLPTTYEDLLSRIQRLIISVNDAELTVVSCDQIEQEIANKVYLRFILSIG